MQVRHFAHEGLHTYKTVTDNRVTSTKHVAVGFSPRLVVVDRGLESKGMKRCPEAKSRLVDLW